MSAESSDKQLKVPFRLHESTRATWVLPGLVMQETGWGEINGTKYMSFAAFVLARGSSLFARVRPCWEVTNDTHATIFLTSLRI
jgi:hypothetical protein